MSGYIYMAKLIVCGEPDDLKKIPDVNPAGTRRLDVTCDHVTTALRAMHEMHGVRSATVFGQSMHLLVDDSVKRAEIDENCAKSVSVTPRSTKSVLHSKTCLSSFRPSTPLNDKRPHDYYAKR